MKPSIPFNIDILDMSDTARTRNMKPIEVTDTFIGSTQNFHDSGLFSTEIFGDVGTPERDNTFAYIKLNTTIIVPSLYERLVRLKALYGQILSGTGYAVFDEDEKDFVTSTPLEGDTGYSFFLKHFPKIVFKKNNSPKRNIIIDIIEKYRDKMMMDKYLVLPAGLRDLTIDRNGKVTEDEVNELYRNLLAVCNSLKLLSGGKQDGLDRPRYKIQTIANQIYDHFYNILEGKKGFAQGKFGSRNIFNGTRNVLSPMDTSAEILGDLRAPTIHHSFAGLFQTMKGTLPSTIHHIRQHPLYQHAFTGDEEYVHLVNKETLHNERVKISQMSLDKWQTVEGLEKLIDFFENPNIRFKNIEIDGYFLGLIYKDKKKFMILKDINELPEGWDINNVQPIKFIEFFYCCLYKTLYDCVATVTRYPVASNSSIYPCRVYTKTTNTALPLTEYVDGEMVEENGVAREFPYVPDNEEPSYFNTMSPHSTRLSGLGADHDGDKTNPVSP